MQFLPSLRQGLFLTLTLFSSLEAFAEDTQKLPPAEQAIFEKDRAAILAMTGKFKVSFNFHETYAFKDGYDLKEKAYSESAYEIVKVVEDTGSQIVLQHILQVEMGLEDMIVKHWGQVWTYEDQHILEYQKDTTWKKSTLTADQVKGTWSQYVTQTDDSPRYESYAKWDHYGDSSIWRSKETSRPLPRREYTKRKDYDLIMGINTHAISANGWVHSQANRKLVKRDGVEEYLCAERGFNTYERDDKYDFSLSNTYWESTGPFWSQVRSFWTDQISKEENFSYQKKVDEKSLGKTIRSLAPDEENKTLATRDEIAQAIKPFLRE